VAIISKQFGGIFFEFAEYKNMKRKESWAVLSVREGREIKSELGLKWSQAAGPTRETVDKKRRGRERQTR